MNDDKIIKENLLSKLIELFKKLTCFDGNRHTTICFGCTPGIILLFGKMSGSSKTESFSHSVRNALQLYVFIHEELSPNGEPIILKAHNGKTYSYDRTRNSIIEVDPE